MLRRPSKRRPSSSTRAAGSAAPPARSKHEQAKQEAQRANKIFPRNLTAQAAYLVPGNPVITRPEDAVANCFPGLEIDIRNLDRRFFPGLVFDFIEEGARLAYVDAFQDPDLKLNTDDARQLYLQLADDDLQKRLSKGSWYLDEIEQNGLRISMKSLKDTTAWRIVRSLELGPVTIRLKQRKTEHVSRPHRRKHTVTLKGWRRRFMDPKTGVLSGAY